MNTIELKLSDAEIDRIAEAVARRLNTQPHADEQVDKLLTVREAAVLLRCSERHLRVLIKLRRLRATKLTHGGGARVRVKQSEIERLINQSTH
jgi:excisionase family DNA binding protein